LPGSPGGDGGRGRLPFVVQKIIGTCGLLSVAKSQTRNQPAKGPEDGGPNNHEVEVCHRGVHRIGWCWRGTGRGRMANAKNIGWAIYAAGFVVWLFAYLSAGHAPLFGWDVATPWWISSFVPNLEAELALMFASMVPIYWRAAVRKRA
jgi:hypothetical protein